MYEFAADYIWVCSSREVADYTQVCTGRQALLREGLIIKGSVQAEC